jgi:glycosyltransferase involved in cell wall biosynthesis
MEGYTCLKNDGKGKKAALRTGWKHCQRPFVVHTDADVLWTPKAWQQLNDSFDATPALRLCSLWPQIQGKWADALDFSAMGLHAQAATGLRLPFLASGAALCVERAAITDLSAALGPSNSGDDVFLLHAVVAKYGPESVAVFDCPDLKTHGKDRWLTIWQQRLRWVSKSKHYKNYAAQSISLWIWLFHAFAPVTVWVSNGWWALLGFVAAKACLDFLFFGWAKQFSFGTVALSLVYWLYLPWVPLMGWLSKASWHKAKAFGDN